MSTQILLTCLLIADVVLGFAVVAMIIIVNREWKKRRSGIDESSLTEFRKLLDESQASTNYLLEVMNESRKALKEIVYALDEKEEKLTNLINESKIEYEKLRSSISYPDGNSIDKKNEAVIAMFNQGLTKKEISQKLNLTEGEIDLIIDLDKTKHGDSGR